MCRRPQRLEYAPAGAHAAERSDLRRGCARFRREIAVVKTRVGRRPARPRLRGRVGSPDQAGGAKITGTVPRIAAGALSGELRRSAEARARGQSARAEGGFRNLVVRWDL